MKNYKNVAIIAGGGTLPKIVYEELSDPYVIGFEGMPCSLSDRAKFHNFNQLGYFFEDLNARGIRSVVMVGDMKRPLLDETKFDEFSKTRSHLIFNAMQQGDDTLLKYIISLFLEANITPIGAHEVVIESPDHNTELELLPPTQITRSLEAFRERVLALKQNELYRYILIFKNQGQPAGASLEHTHTQLIALPIVPEVVNEEIMGCKEHYKKNGRCIYCDIISQELEDGRRVVCKNKHFITLVPYAPRFPFEMWLLPRFHAARFEECCQLDELASILKESLLKMRTALDMPPYNFVFHIAPVGNEHLSYYHWHIEIMPKLTKIAGFEQGTGFHINPTIPEEAARILRETQTSNR